jgi:hypothetical protein
MTVADAARESWTAHHGWADDGPSDEFPDWCEVTCVQPAADNGFAKVSFTGHCGFARARLAAAAPRMLAALQAVLTECGGGQKPHSSDSYLPAHIVDAVRAAAVAAEGGAP